MAGRDGRRLLGLASSDDAGVDDARTRDADCGADDIDERDAFDRVTFTDEELTVLALDASPFDPFDPEVDPFEPTG